MSEISARDTFKKHVLYADPKAHIQRFEDKLSAGIPDINIAFSDGHEIWVEAKHVKSLPAWQTTPLRVGMRREQVIWLNARKKLGCACFVLVRLVDREWALFDDYFDELEEGVDISTFYSLSKWCGKVLKIDEMFNLSQRTLDISLR